MRPIATWISSVVLILFLVTLAYAGLLSSRAAEKAAPVPPEARLPDICGFAVFRVCGAARSNRFAPEWVAVSPAVITTITNPPESPEGCVKLFSLTGRGVYVYGDENTTALALRQADQERRQELCDNY